MAHFIASRKAVRLFIPLCFLLPFFPPAAWSAGGLRIGAARTDITPSFDIDMNGYYFQRFPVDVHDPLYAKTLVLDDGSTILIIVACDLEAMPKETTAYVRGEVERRFAIPPQNVMLSSTHTHTGPMFRPKYLEFLGPKIVDCIQMALNRRQEGRLGYGMTKAPELPKNRRVGRTPGAGHGLKLKKPVTEGAVDPDVHILYCETPEGQPIAAYVNFAMHLDYVGGSVISADFPYFMHEILRGFFGRDLISFFTAGCCGDINAKFIAAPKGFARAEAIGQVLGGKVLEAYPFIQPRSDMILKAGLNRVSVDLLPVSDDEIAWAKEVGVALLPERVQDRELADRMWRARNILDRARYREKPYTQEVQVFAVGDVGIVALANEVFVDYGLRIRKASPFPHTFVVELANDSHFAWYMPTREAVESGDYESIQNRYAAGAGDLIAADAINLLQQLYSQ